MKNGFSANLMAPLIFWNVLLIDSPVRSLTLTDLVVLIGAGSVFKSYLTLVIIQFRVTT